jgi:hypothetical protein
MTAAPHPPATDARRPGAEASKPPGSPDPPVYEFEDAHKDSFRALAGSVSFVGVCTMLFGAMLCMFFVGAIYSGFLSSAIGTAFGAAICLTTAFWMVLAGRELSALVSTRGRDVAHLMATVRQLRRLFGLARVIVILLALLAVFGGSVVVWCTLVVDRGGKCFAPWG